MPQGPGKYDPECVEAMVKTGAKICVLAVIGGKHGNGFSVNSVVPDVDKTLPQMLRAMADQLEGIS